MTSAPAIGFEYRPSRLLAQLCVSVALLALAAIALCGLAPILKVVLALVLLAAAGHAMHRVARSNIVAAGLSQEGGWVMRRVDGSDVAAALTSSRVIGAYVLLQLTEPGSRSETLLLGPDNSDADIRRRLRMRLAATHPAGIPADP